MKKTRFLASLMMTALFYQGVSGMDNDTISSEEHRLEDNFKNYLKVSAQNDGLCARDLQDLDLSSLPKIFVLSKSQFEELLIKDTKVLDKRTKKGYAVKKGEDGAPTEYYAVKPKVHNQPVYPSDYMAKLRSQLPVGLYNLCDHPEYTKSCGDMPSRTDLMSWGLAEYSFQFSKSSFNAPKELASLVIPADRNLREIKKLVEMTKFFRDAIRTRTNQFTPTTGSLLMQDMAQRYGAKVTVFTGKELKTNFEAVYEVGKGSKDVPNVTILEWLPTMDYKITLDLVGKGVCFDTGGNNLKTDPSLMYMDKGGALAQMALAELIMDQNLPIKLRFGSAWVVNSPGGSATNTNDIYKIGSTTVENKNTDAEGRLIMAPILDYFAKHEPAQITQTQATLTGAVQQALGVGTAGAYVPDEVSELFFQAARFVADPMWPMPSDTRLLEQLKQSDADLGNMGGSYGGSILGEEFLRYFASKNTTYIHIDSACAIRGNTGITPGMTNGDLFGVHATYEFLKRMAQ